MKRTLSEWLDWQETAHDKAWDLGLKRVSTVWQALGAPRLAYHHRRRYQRQRLLRLLD